ncbi:MAG: cysteine desulfurase [Thermoanaerobacterales bacterium]|nr:cysteine desulfurase [Thermoanaerobacterales bacterium]
MKKVYLDNSSTTRVSPKAAEAVFEAMVNHYGNPSSLHEMGIVAEKYLKEARRAVSTAMGVRTDQIYFTSGGTESNNLAIKGVLRALNTRDAHIITTAVEHPSVLEVFKQLEKEGFSVTYLSVNNQGHVDIDELDSSLTSDTVLVSMMYVNNEVGSIQDIERASNIIKKNAGTLFHVDAVQAFGKIRLIPGLKGIDLLSVSSHKIYGPMGVGAVFVKDGVKLRPLFDGGGQEFGIRSGTENIPGIAGFRVAVEEAYNNLDNWGRHMKELKALLLSGVQDEIDDIVVNGPESGGAPHILNLSFLGVKGEILLHALESHGIYVSTGSACSSHKSGKSHVLKAMGKTSEEIEGAVRFSLSPFITTEDIYYTVDVLKRQVNEIRKFVRR